MTKGFSFIAQRCAGVVIGCVSKVVINFSVRTRIQFHSSELFKFCDHSPFQCRRFVHNLYFITFNCMIYDYFNAVDLGLIQSLYNYLYMYLWIYMCVSIFICAFVYVYWCLVCVYLYALFVARFNFMRVPLVLHINIFFSMILLIMCYGV